MGKFQILIVLNDENGSYQAWKKMFKDKEGNFSGWIQDKILEEQAKQLDSNYIYTKLADIESQKSYWESQLDKSKELQEAKKQKQEQPDYVEERLEHDFDVLVRKIGMYLQYQFILKELPERDVWEQLARDYLNTGSNQEILYFLESKGYQRKNIQKRSIELFTNNSNGGESN